MRNITAAFQETLAADNRNYIVWADITLTDNTVLNLENSDIMTGGFSMEDAVSDDNSFTAVGSTVINAATLILNNIDDTYTQYDFVDASVVMYVGLTLTDRSTTRTEKIKLGTFTVDEANYDAFTVTLSLLDNIAKLDRPYSTSPTVYPASLATIVRESCVACGVSLDTYTFPHSDFVAQIRPADDAVTHREVIGWAAAIAGCFVHCTANGAISFSWFDQDALENETEGQIHEIRDLVSQDIALDDTVITGVKVTQLDVETQEIKEYTYGVTGYMISVEDNGLITTAAEAQAIAGYLGTQLVGLTFRKANITHLNTPAIEAGDVGILTDRKGHDHPILITRTNFSVGQNQTTVCGTETPARNSATRFASATKAFVQARKLVKKEMTARDLQYLELTEALAEKAGLYTSTESDGLGGTIYYMHDQPTREDSSILWKMTAEAWGVSTDGGQHWNAGMTVDGDTIVRILSATGINADWIDAGTFTIRDGQGNTIFQASNETHSVFIDGTTVQIGGSQSLDQAISGAVSEANAYADDILGDYSGYVSDRFDEIEGRLDGQVETWYYPYDPTLSNAPASSWDTEAKKQNHQGDTFTNTTTGVSYRFIYESGVWQWKVIPDTIATQALQDAARAQDTADHKRRVFYQQPYPPYDLGDLWVEGASGDIWRCAVQKADGTSFASTDWVLASKYTDDTAFNTFIDGDYASTIQSLQSQLDGKAETWYQATDPSIEWATAGVPWIDHNGSAFLDHELTEIYTTYPEEAARHEGDLWKRTTDNKEFMFKNGEWVEMNVPDEVFDEIDGKAQIFGVQPVTPYHVGDLWFTGDEIKYCQTERLTGNFNASDWVRKEGYTDDTALQEWIDGDFADIVEDLQEQADKKAETWYQNTDPSTAWTTSELRALHKGDLWYCTANISGTSYKQGTTWYWSGSAWQQQNVPASVFDQIDGKAQIFINQPTTPYHVGDLWFNSATSDIQTCIRQRLTGDFASADWEKRNKYTDDSGLEDFIDTVYTSQIESFQRQIDGKVETWYQTTDPAADWGAPVNDNWIDSSENTFLDHNGEPFVLLWEEDRFHHEGDLWHNTTDNTEWLLKDGMWQAMDIPDELFDLVDGKAQIFTTTPTVPYNKDDMWFTGNEILVSNVTRTANDSYNRSDWVKKDFYTDDSAFTNWKNGAYKDTIDELTEQTDKKAETWYQSTNPSTAWTTADLRALHKGDLWYCTADISGTSYKQGTTWYWSGSAWQQQNVPQEVFDDIDGKAQIFVSQPVPPYHVGDLWFNNSESDIKTCVTARTSGSYNAGDWQVRNKYTDDSTFNTWKNGTYKSTVEDFQDQLDGKIESWSQTTEPSWSSADRAKHVGDLWYNPQSKVTKRYTLSGSTYSWEVVEDPEARTIAKAKRRVFTSTPTPPYDVGDMWWTSTVSGEATLKMAKTARSSGSCYSGDWIEPKYVDSSQVQNAIDSYDTSLGQPEVFNKLTNGQANQGLYIENGKVYVNATYILAGTLAGERINGKGLRILNSNNQVTLEIDSSGNVTINASSLSINGYTAATQSYAQDRVDALDSSLNQTDVFNRLTNNSANQGIYLNEGRIYVNGEYIKATSIYGSSIRAHTIAAGKLDIDDLSAVEATIGGFMINGSSIYAQGNGANNANVKYIEIKTTDVSGGKKGTIDLRRSDGVGIHMEDGLIESSTSPLRMHMTPGAWIEGDVTTTVEENSFGRTSFYGDLRTASNVPFVCGGSKSAVRDTEHYGEQKLYCYETPTPMFGDIGDAELDDTGVCYVDIDDIFQETVKTTIAYFVFLQKCGPGDCWVEDRQAGYFVVRGTPGLKFTWEVKAKQIGYEEVRYNDTARDISIANFGTPDYANMYAMELENIIQEMEG